MRVITSQSPDGGGTLLVVPAGSLDSEVSLRPNAHIFNSDKASWDHDLEHIHRFEGLPG
jgi:hypothetical protein